MARTKTTSGAADPIDQKRASIDPSEGFDETLGAVEHAAREAAKDAGTNGRIRSMRIVFGEELFQPLQYHMVRIGPFEATVELREGDDPAEVTRCTLAELEQIAVEEFDRKMRAYLGRVHETPRIVRESKTGRAS